MLNLIYIIGCILLYVQSFKKANLIFTLGMAVTSSMMFLVLGDLTGITMSFNGFQLHEVIEKEQFALYFTLAMFLIFAFSRKDKSSIGVSILAPIALLDPSKLSLSLILFLGDALNLKTSSRLSKIIYSSIFGLILANRIYSFDHVVSVFVFFLAFILSVLALFNNLRILRNGNEATVVFSALVIPILILDLVNTLGFSNNPVVILVSGLILNLAWLIYRKNICSYIALASLGSFLFLTQDFNSIAVIIFPFLVTYHWMNLKIEAPEKIKNYSFFLIRLTLCSIGFFVFSLMAQWNLVVFILLLVLFISGNSLITKNTAIYSHYFYQRSLVLILGVSVLGFIFFTRSLL